MASSPQPERDLRELAAHIAAAQAELTRLLAAFDAAEAWAADGIRSCAHWLSINAGLDFHAASELLRVGRALEALPHIAAAFAAGQLSLDKVRTLTRVATPADDQVWAELGLQASASQLSHICRAYRRAMEADDPARAQAQLARRAVHAHWREDGMLR